MLPQLAAPYLPEARIITLPGRGEAFVRVGPARPEAATVLLLHGWLATADLNWFALYEPLVRQYNVIALDHRGHGRGLRSAGPFVLEDTADDAAAVLDHLGCGPVIACGYSMGGPIGLHLAQRRPDLVNGLVLCATALEWRDRWHDRLEWRLLALLSAGLRLGGDQWLAKRIIDDMAAGNDLIAQWRPHLLAEAKRLNPRAALEAGRALSRFDARPMVAAIDLPAAVVATRRDRLVQPRRQLQLAEALRALRFDLEADHDAFLRQPEAWADTITQAVNSVAIRLPPSTRPTTNRPTTTTPAGNANEGPLGTPRRES